MAELVRQRQTIGSETDRLRLNHGAKTRLHKGSGYPAIRVLTFSSISKRPRLISVAYGCETCPEVAYSCSTGALQKSFVGGLPVSRIPGPIRFAGSILKDRAHIWAFFNSPDEAHRVLLPFVNEGLELGQKALRTT